MKKKLSIHCPKHGTVVLSIDPDRVLGVERVCPECEHAARHPQKHADAPYPLQGTSPSVIPELNRGD